MNKTAIKNFAIWARQKLIEDIGYKAGLVGVTEKGIKAPLAQSTRDIQFFDIGAKEPYSITGDEIRQREKLVKEIEGKRVDSDYSTAYKSVIEEVAYTWFNRLIAVRFMEVNDYLPSRIRVLSSESEGKTEPDIVTTPFEAELEYTETEKQTIIALKGDNKLDALFRMLFIKQCNALNGVLPQLFEETSDYTELLLNIAFTDKEGIIYHLVNDIEEDDFNVEKEGQVEIIGWLYQYYNTVPKDETFALLKKNVKITKERIPAATQLFTPDWIVRYMVENSLGRMWVEGHPNEELKKGWKYYLEEAEQEEDVKKQLEAIRAEYSQLKPEDIKVIDPCMGSGHILVYAFDVLMQIYESYGYSQRDAAKSILENNIYGLDIDNRAYQLAYFAVMMKAREYNRRILSSGVKCNLYAIQESNGINRKHLEYFGSNLSPVERQTAIGEITEILDTMKDAREYGSIIDVKLFNKELLERFLEGHNAHEQMSFETVGIDNTQQRLIELIDIAYVMAQKYEIVITNPPYMGASGMGEKLSIYVKKNYPDSKSDLFAVFIERCGEMNKKKGYQGMITQHSWMFLTSYEKLREKLLMKTSINMIHLGPRAFEEISGEVVQTTSVVFRNVSIIKHKGIYVKLVNYPSQQEKEKAFINRKNIFVFCQENFKYIPGKTNSYWVSESAIENFSRELLTSRVDAVKGLDTCDNDTFVRDWYEVSIDSIGLDIKSTEDTYNHKWFPYCKGGGYRKWSGFTNKIVNWENDGIILRNIRDLNGRIKSRPQNIRYYFNEGLTWSTITSNKLSMRYMNNSIFGGGGSGLFANENLMLILGFLNSKVAEYYLNLLNPTLNFLVGDILSLPIIVNSNQKIEELVCENIQISQMEWDSYETSLGFKVSPLIKVINGCYGSDIVDIKANLIKDAFRIWDNYTREQYKKLKANEESINKIYIDIYNLQNDISPEIQENDISIRKGNIQQDIRGYISYAVGCMFGRYSLDVEGLVYAGGDWDDRKYSTFIPDRNNIIPITDEEYFEDDIVGLFVAFVKKTFGEATLEENLDFIAKALGNKGNTSREIIRNYFMKDFFKDHCKVYQKRPIYWLFDSGKQNGFKALIYMHRYDENTIGNLRIDYLHKMQRIYESEINRMQEMIANSGNAREIAVAEKRKEKLTKQLKEAREYDEKVAHLAVARISIDLDDGVKVNYEKVQTGADGKKLEVLAKI